jgi:aminoglycoside 3-N-acetyltransferase
MDAAKELAARWRQSGVEPGDMLLVHSNSSRTIREARRQGLGLTPDVLVDSFLEAVGQEGTVLFPLFNFDFCGGAPFDVRSTPSQMGALTEAARLRLAAVRTGHPVYSFAVLGARAQDFEGVDNRSAYSDDSPFGMLRRAGGKIAVLDLPDQNSMTFYHHVEEMKQVDYRYFKNFTAPYTDASGVTSNRTYELYVRDVGRGVVTDVDAAGNLMWEKGLYRGDRPKEGAGLRTVAAAEMFDFVASIIDAGQARGLLYSIEDGKK